MTTRNPPGGKPRGAPLGFFAAVAGYLGRPDPVCPVHGVRHTGKLARLIVLDLALLDATGDPRYWEEARLRAEEVAAQLAPDPEHGSLIYLPGRLDPRNCSNSVIDSGECTDALARLLSHPRAESLEEDERRPLEEAVAGTPRRTWRRRSRRRRSPTSASGGPWGWPPTARWRPVPDWTEAVRLALESALDEQRADGSWGYEPRSSEHGGHPGASDLTVYYHGRCLAFLLHILDCLPALDGPRPESALRRGLEFLAAVTTPDGRKPLALEGKRWFWVSQGEAGSNAYDVYALLRGAARFGVDAWRRLAARSWASLVGRQAPDGSIVAGDSARTPDFVCPTFHTADTAWAAQVLDDLGSLPEVAPDAGRRDGARPARAPLRGRRRVAPGERAYRGPAADGEAAPQHPVGRRRRRRHGGLRGRHRHRRRPPALRARGPGRGGLLHPLPRPDEGPAAPRAPGPAAAYPAQRPPGAGRTAVALRRPPAAGPGPAPGGLAAPVGGLPGPLAPGPGRPRRAPTGPPAPRWRCCRTGACASPGSRRARQGTSRTGPAGSRSPAKWPWRGRRYT